MKRVAIVIGLVAVLFVLGTIMGCGGKSKYVGTYVSEKNQSVLELKSDGTYRFETKGFVGHVTTGEWSVMKDEGGEGISFTPALSLTGPACLVKTRKGNNLVEPILGETFVKQN